VPCRLGHYFHEHHTASLGAKVSVCGEETRADSCEHTRILRVLVEHPQGNLEEIQQKTLQSTQEEPTPWAKGIPSPTLNTKTWQEEKEKVKENFSTICKQK
jgi:hypothetical protein